MKLFGDLSIISYCKTILKGGSPSFAKAVRTRMTKAHHEMPVQQQNEREKEWKKVPKAKVHETLRALLPDLMAERIKALGAAITADHLEFGKKRKEKESAPDLERVRSAAMLQVQDIVNIFLRRQAKPE
ncbi:MAG: hypothetical protein IPJ14_03415 [Kineosporiaceae bacterium]|nr:hypothetical protein [Kineosporiaceae bacterium]